MIGLILNLVMALLWAWATGPMSPGNVLVGFLLGYAALHLVDPLMPTAALGGYLRRSHALLRLAGFFAWELMLSNLKVARDVLRVHPRHAPAVVAVPMAARTDLEITLLAILLILTPGTLALDVDEEGHVLYIHVLDAPDPEAFRHTVTTGFEARILAVTR